MKKIVKIICAALLVVAVIIGGIIISIIYKTKYEINDVTEFVNEGNNYKVVFQSVGQPEWPFGDTKVMVTLKNGQGEKINSFKTYISDDGANASDSNISVTWFEEFVQITLMGSEQQDEIYSINYEE